MTFARLGHELPNATEVSNTRDSCRAWPEMELATEIERPRGPPDYRDYVTFRLMKPGNSLPGERSAIARVRVPVTTSGTANC